MIRVASAAIVLAATLGALFADQAVGSVSSPPLGDFSAIWMEERIKANGLATAMRDDDVLVSSLLVDPSSPYSALADLGAIRLGGDPWKNALRRMREDFDVPMKGDEARHAVAWDLGLTNALPGLAASGQPVSFAGDALVQANLIKSGVSVDIFVQSIRLFGERHYAVAAYYAVAAQVLHDRVPALPESRRRASGVREMVGTRFLLADRLTDMVGSDWAYLSNMLESEMSTWHAGRRTIYGHREIALAFRVARVAAAYRQSLSYEGAPPCDAHGMAERQARELCFSQATDRAVHAWYRRVLDNQLMQDESHHGLWPPELGPPLLSLTYARSGRETMPHGELFAAHAGHAEMADRLLIEDRMAGSFSDEQAAEVLDSSVAAHVCEGGRP